MAAEFTDNLIEFLEDKLKEFNANLSVAEGTAVRDVFIKPFSVIFQPIVDEILKVRANLSLQDAENLTETDLDRLAANFFITRKQGAQAVGSIRLFYNEPVDDFVAQGTVFLAANGVRFVASEDVTITESGLRLNTFGDLFFQDIDAQAEAAGTDGNIAAELIADLLVGSDKIVDVTNPAPFSGGTSVETNAQLIDRLSIAITFRNLINTPGATLILLENFARLLDVGVVGFADTQTIEGEVPTPVPDGIEDTFQLIETEDVIVNLTDVFIKVNDEIVTVDPVEVAGNPHILDFKPVVAETLLLSKDSTFQASSLLEETTHYTVNNTTGEITITLAGETFLTGNDLHARYTAGRLDDSFVVADFNGGLTFASPPPLGTTLFVNYRYHLMRRDRLTGDNLVLGDDTFGTVENVHIGGKVDYYLKYVGLTEVEKRIDGVDGENFLFDQGPGDAPASLVVADELVASGPAVPAGPHQLQNYPVTALALHVGTIAGPMLTLAVDYTQNLTTGQITLTPAGQALVDAAIPPELHAAYTATRQYVADVQLPIVSVKNVELVDTATNLPSGTFLTQVFGSGVPAGPNEFRLEILPNKLNLNMSMRQKISLILSPDVVGESIFFRYFSDPDFETVQEFVDDPVNRIVTADLLVRAPMPVFVDLEINYSRATGGPDPATVQSTVENYINSLKLGQCLSVFDIANTLSDAGVKFVELPFTLDALRVNLDFSELLLTSENKLIIPRNFQFIARDITISEVDLEDCDAI